MKPLLVLLAACGLLMASRQPTQAQIIYDGGNYCTPSRVCYFGGGYYGWPVWRKLIPTIAALKIYAYHHRVFNALGYSIPLSLTTRANAKRNWERLTA